MKLCTNCKHYAERYGFCVSPANGVSPVDGKPFSRLASVWRGDFSAIYGQICGPDGANFEESPKPYFDPVDYSKITTVSKSGFVSVVHQYFSKWRK
jgi:hypothetical protein